MEMMKSSFVSFVTVTSKKGIVTKHIAKWVVLGVFGYFGGTKMALRVPESKF